jgi:uncharacterized protein (TIGR00369 family)
MTTVSPFIVSSPFLESLGVRPVEWGEDYAIFELSVAARHLNRYGTVHGGVLTTMIDAAGGFAGCYAPPPLPPREAVTLMMTTSFAATTDSGTLRVVGRKRSGGRKIFFATVEVTNASGELVAFGEGSYRYFGASVSAA